MTDEIEVRDVPTGVAKEAAGPGGVGAWWKSGTAIVAGIAAGTVLVHAATGARYGFDRDELMLLEDARHLAWGYVAYPPVTPFFGRVSLELFGTSLRFFRLFAASSPGAPQTVLATSMKNALCRSVDAGKSWVAVTAGLPNAPILGRIAASSS